MVRVTVAKVLRAALSKVRFTTHCTCCAGMPAVALFSWVPSIIAADRRYLLPLSSHVTSGRDLMSATGGGDRPLRGRGELQEPLRPPFARAFLPLHRLAGRA